MRFIRNEIQTPRRLVQVEKRRSLPFFILTVGVCVLIIGVAGFFSAFFFHEMIQEQWNIHYRVVQTNSIYVAAAGCFLYIFGAIILKVPLGKTTYYKISTIMKNEPFDPPRKNDFTKAIFARLNQLSDEWAFFSQVKPPDCDFVIPQVLVGPGGAFSVQPIAEAADRKNFKDPGPEFEKASKKLGNAIGLSVLPITLFSSPKLVTIYHTYCKPKTRVMYIREISDFFEKRSKKMSENAQKEAEQKIFNLISGTPPGMD